MIPLLVGEIEPPKIIENLVVLIFASYYDDVRPFLEILTFYIQNIHRMGVSRSWGPAMNRHFFPFHFDCSFFSGVHKFGIHLTEIEMLIDLIAFEFAPKTKYPFLFNFRSD